MLTQYDKEHLRMALFSNRVVLFLGAGFSCNATSISDKQIPSGSQLCQILWDFCEYDEEYEETDLQTIFEAALKSRKGLKPLYALLKDYLECRYFPEWYRLLSKQYWLRMYTTNIDNLVEKIYEHPILPFKLDTYDANIDDFRERDQYLERLQFIKLNGSISNDDPRKYTFSARQYAKRSTDFDIWYDHFARDYMTNVTVFIGTSLKEPLFWRHIELRERKRGEPESRPRSYLICPTISSPRKDILNEYNIVPVESNAEEFFKWLEENIGDPPSRENVIETSSPLLKIIFQHRTEQLRQPEISSLQRFYQNFELVKIEEPSHSYRRKAYLLGKEPDWQDLYHDLDAWRDINNTIIAEIEACVPKEDEVHVVALLGSAGSGKSTVLKRACLHFCAKGFACFFSTSEDLINYRDFAKALKIIDRRLLIFLDDTDFALRWLARIVDLCKDIDKKPIFIVASRINRYERTAGQLLKTVSVKEIFLPDLSDEDINRIIDRLSEEQLLGKLRGLSPKERFAEFKNRARKQILVAMREATEGRDFDEIIRNEYEEIDPHEAKILYLCIALASSEHHKLSLQQILAASDDRSSAALSYLEKNLKGLIIQFSGHRDYIIETRHPSIATFIVDDIATRIHLMEAYQRLLPVFAHDISRKVGYGNKIYRLYRRLINHLAIYRRFAEKIEFARSIYESVKHFVSEDCHFWLQYGSLELEYGELSDAANYLAQAESIDPTDDFVLTAKGHLRYRQAKEAESYQTAERFLEEAKEVITDQIWRRPEYSPHPFHIFGSQELAFAHKWIYENDQEEYKNILKNALVVVEVGLKIHYRNNDLKRLEDDLKRELMMLAVP